MTATHHSDSPDPPDPEGKRCPSCESPDVQLRHVTYHEQPGKSRYRADVSLKCRDCSMVLSHGIVCPQEHFRPQSADHRSTWQAAEVLRALSARSAEGEKQYGDDRSTGSG